MVGNWRATASGSTPELTPMEQAGDIVPVTAKNGLAFCEEMFLGSA
ncbi:hypothetical protein I552_5817 [Mycobacterium xenopi 3993]|nr:hypothetical protein I552_5817 [Mycobacterium xenopi 3993]